MAKGKPNRLSRVLGATVGVLVLLAAIVAGGLALCYQVLFPKPYHELVSRYAQEFSVDENLVYSVMKCESSFDPNATSSVPAMGLMQITEDTFDWVKSRLEPEADTGYDAMYDPAANIRYGTCLLAALEEQFGGERNALCAYHAGWGNATAWLADPAYSAGGEIHTIPFADTAAYVEKVLATRDVYRDLYGDALL